MEICQATGPVLQAFTSFTRYG